MEPETSDLPSALPHDVRPGLAPAAYLGRVVEDELVAALGASPAVLIEGPRACGKTWTGRHCAASEALLDAAAAARLAANIDPAALLDGAMPRLLDEWQIAPDIWNPMRRACDDRGVPGQFILTGSADPPDDITRHSGAGRVLRVRMRPMSLYESGESVGSVSLQDLFGPEPVRVADPGPRTDDVIRAACRGGWPALVRNQADGATALRVLTGYLEEISRTDITLVDGTRRDPVNVRRLLRSLGRNIASEASYATLADDTAGDTAGQSPVNRRTVADYMGALTRLFVSEDLPAWKPAIQSRAQLRGTPKRHMADPSLAAAALDASSEAVLAELVYAGQIFEALAVRDLRIYAQAAQGDVFHYRDSDGLEVDAIVRLHDGRWLAAEVKLGSAAGIEQAVRSLRRLADKIDPASTQAPSRLVVLTASGYGYEHPEGVSIVPITALGP